MAMNVGFTNPRPQMVQEDPYSVQPQPMDSGLASPLAQALMQQMGGGGGFGGPAPYAPQSSDPSGPGKSDPMLNMPGMQPPQMSAPSYNYANPWQGQTAGNSGIVPPGLGGMPPRFGQQKPMQSPILGPTNQQSPYMPPNFRRRLFQPGGQIGSGGGGVGGINAGGGLNLAGGGNSSDRSILPRMTFV
jgi:hypothetical protein